MNELYKLVKYHAGLYYDKDSPEISDAEYDSLVRELRQLENDYPQFSRKDSPTQTVGGEASNLFAKVEHVTPMLSLDNVFTPEELVNFFDRINAEGFVCEMKIDGLAVSLVYEDGIFVKGATRGNGRVGEDVTENLMLVDAVPKKLIDAPAGRVEVRGEVLMTNERFNAVNAMRESKGEKLFANPRNAAAGTLRQSAKNNHVIAERGLDIFLYYLVDAEKFGITTQESALMWLESHGLPIQSAYKFCETLGGVKDFIYQWQNERYKLNYHTDGVVVKLNDITQWHEIGATSHAPRWAVAYKYPPKEARTRLNDIEIQIGRSGVLTPVAILDPVIVAGTTVQRATLHNDKYIQQRDIRIGDYVYVSKAGEIIPQITKVDMSARTGAEKVFVMPEKCPFCGSEVRQKERVIIDGNKTKTMAAHVCTNSQCPARLKESVRHFVSRKAMDIRGIGKMIAYSLVDSGKFHSLTDIYRLSLEDWQEITGSEKIAEKIMTEIEDSKSRPLSAFLTAIGIPHVEKTIAESLAEYFGTIDALESASVRDIMNALNPDIVNSARTVHEFFRDENNIVKISERVPDSTVKSFSAALETIPGIKRTACQKLASYFGNVQALAKASPEIIAEALNPEAESSERISRSVYEFLRDNDSAEIIRKKSEDGRKFTSALCVIPDVERGIAIKLARNFGTLEDLLSASQEDIASAITPKAEVIIANSVHKFFRDNENISLIDEFESLGLNMNASGTNRAMRSGHERNKPVQPSELQDDRFRGKIFVFTGTLTSMTRNEAAERVMSLGGLFSNSVTLKTSYLVAGEKPGSKLRKAESLGVTILTEQEFLRMTEDS